MDLERTIATLEEKKNQTQTDKRKNLILCDYNSVVNDWIVAVMIDIEPSLVDSEITSDDIITLNLDITPESKLSMIWFLATSLSLVWQARQLGKPLSLFQIKAMIGAEIAVMKNTKFKEAALKIDSAINLSLM